MITTDFKELCKKKLLQNIYVTKFLSSINYLNLKVCQMCLFSSSGPSGRLTIRNLPEIMKITLEANLVLRKLILIELILEN